MKFEIKSRESVYRGFFRLDQVRLRHELFGGGLGPALVREIFERGHSVGVLPYDPDQGTVVLIEQFRIGALEAGQGPWLFEVVAGIRESDETEESVARRETIEETGTPVSSLEPVCRYLVSPGGTSESTMLYCGRVDSRGLDGRLLGLEHEHEDIRVHVVPVEEALGMIADGRLNSAMPIIALQWLALNRARLHQRWQLPPP